MHPTVGINIDCFLYGDKNIASPKVSFITWDFSGQVCIGQVAINIDMASLQVSYNY